MASKLMLNEMGALFRQMVKNNFAQAQSLWSLFGGIALYRGIIIAHSTIDNQNVSAWCGEVRNGT